LAIAIVQIVLILAAERIKSIIVIVISAANVVIIVVKQIRARTAARMRQLRRVQLATQNAQLFFAQPVISKYT
jgi:hypothetical protein